jgi:hypothetical protein
MIMDYENRMEANEWKKGEAKDETDMKRKKKYD